MFDKIYCPKLAVFGHSYGPWRYSYLYKRQVRICKHCGYVKKG